MLLGILFFFIMDSIHFKPFKLPSYMPNMENKRKEIWCLGLVKKLTTFQKKKKKKKTSFLERMVIKDTNFSI